MSLVSCAGVYVDCAPAGSLVFTQVYGSPITLQGGTLGVKCKYDLAGNK